eukprot:snap_masked-scaffold_9-processed-gene-13.31-mRNA-1 protein AED:1.00 eAED:1.00 QI:0/0/0/0/1/1/2/0/79
MYYIRICNNLTEIYMIETTGNCSKIRLEAMLLIFDLLEVQFWLFQSSVWSKVKLSQIAIADINSEVLGTSSSNSRSSRK